MPLTFSFSHLGNESQMSLIAELNKLYGNNGHRIDLNNVNEILSFHEIGFEQFNDPVTKEKFISRHLISNRDSEHGDTLQYVDRIQILGKDDEVRFRVVEGLSPLDLLCEEILIHNTFNGIGSDLTNALNIIEYDYNEVEEILVMFANLEIKNPSDQQNKGFANYYLPIFNELKKQLTT